MPHVFGKRAICRAMEDGKIHLDNQMIEFILVLSLGIEHTKRSLDAQNTLADKTNELLLKNSETLKMATIETAKAAERPIVDIETLQQCNRNLITSLKEVIEVHAQGEAKREQIQEELVSIEADLKQAMLETAN